ncbi:hypothetical protein Lser_V15G41127 [Lactuca serriola]
MKSGACSETSSTVSVFFLFFLLLSPVFSTINFKHANKTFESKKMKSIKATLGKNNKRFVKSIKSPDGDVIDCVFFHLQPAFDKYPMLKTTMPMGSTKIPNGNKKWRMETEVKQLWNSKGESCPQGTIPIRRQTESEILRSNSISKFGKKLLKRNSIYVGHKHAIGYVRGGEYYGAKATLNVWAPNVTNFDEFSVSQIWVSSEVPNHFAQTVEAGWQVSPTIHGDGLPRFFTYWTNDGYQSGCYDLLCAGFVQTTHEFCLGASIAPISTYNSNQFDITILIWKDPGHGNWCLMVGNIQVGYWPKELFTDLHDHAAKIEFGGEVYNTSPEGPHTTTQMGSGHFSSEGFGKAAYVNNIQMVDQNNVLHPVSDLQLGAENMNCYDVSNGYSSTWGNYIFFGGPGSNPNCP